jgi:hypothetical protein
MVLLHALNPLLLSFERVHLVLQVEVEDGSHLEVSAAITSILFHTIDRKKTNLRRATIKKNVTLHDSLLGVQSIELSTAVGSVPLGKAGVVISLQRAKSLC